MRTRQSDKYENGAPKKSRPVNLKTVQPEGCLPTGYSDGRYCKNTRCGALLVKRPGECSVAFLARKHCDKECTILGANPETEADRVKRLADASMNAKQAAINKKATDSYHKIKDLPLEDMSAYLFRESAWMFQR